MKIEEIVNRVDKLTVLADETIRTGEGVLQSVNLEKFNAFRSASLSFLANIFGSEHSFYTEFNIQVRSGSEYSSSVYIGRGILTAAKQEIEGGWLFTVKGIVSAEIFSDFLEMAEHLLESHYKDPAAVMIGSVLEEHLRQLCIKNSIES